MKNCEKCSPSADTSNEIWYDIHLAIDKYFNIREPLPREEAKQIWNFHAICQLIVHYRFMTSTGARKSFESSSRYSLRREWSLKDFWIDFAHWESQKVFSRLIDLKENEGKVIVRSNYAVNKEKVQFPPSPQRKHLANKSKQRKLNYSMIGWTNKNDKRLKNSSVSCDLGALLKDEWKKGPNQSSYLIL